MNSLSFPVKSALRELGSDMRNARLRRRIPVAVMFQRAFISRTTLMKPEKGDRGIAMGAYVVVLFALGMIDRLRELASAKSDQIGLGLEEERLPKRIDIHLRRTTKGLPDGNQRGFCQGRSKSSPPQSTAHAALCGLFFCSGTHTPAVRGEGLPGQHFHH
jgi:hypothetical protein